MHYAAGARDAAGQEVTRESFPGTAQRDAGWTRGARDAAQGKVDLVAGTMLSSGMFGPLVFDI